MENYQQLILKLRQDRTVTPELKRFLINKLYEIAFPDRDRIIVELQNWKYEKPFKVRIDSKPLHCVNCGNNHAYYTVYNLKYLPNFGLRLCFKCLSPESREMIAENYWCYQKV